MSDDCRKSYEKWLLINGLKKEYWVGWQAAWSHRESELAALREENERLRKNQRPVKQREF